MGNDDVSNLQQEHPARRNDRALIDSEAQGAALEHTILVTHFQKNGGLTDFWCLGDGDFLCLPALVMPFLRALDEASVKAGRQ